MLYNSIIKIGPKITDHFFKDGAGSTGSGTGSSGNGKSRIAPIDDGRTSRKNNETSSEGKIQRHSRSVPTEKSIKSDVSKQNTGSPPIAVSAKNNSSKNVRRQAPSSKKP